MSLAREHRKFGNQPSRGISLPASLSRPATLASVPISTSYSSLGRLEPKKELHYLLEAVTTPNCGIRHDPKGSLFQLCSPDETLPYYALAYLLVLPSITTRNGKETWGLVVNEAMNQGCPVIATDAVGAAVGGLVRDGASGLVVPERDPQALAAALQRLLDQPVLRQQMSQNSRASMAGWDNEHMVLGFRKALEYAMGDR
jgi:glycosyltransferase involved in cell wall biosynthesis